MKLYEYQAKAQFSKYGIKTPKGVLITNAAQTPTALDGLGNGPWAVKAQVLVGGRGKAGGVKLANTVQEVFTHTSEILGKKLVTHQSGPEGVYVDKVLIEQGVSIAKEIYLAILVDRKLGCPTVIASSQGGTEIEVLAKENPKAILNFPFSAITGLMPYQARTITKKLGVSPAEFNQMSKLVFTLARLFLDLDLSLAEINPLVITKQGDVVALDGKIVMDDNSLFRQKELGLMRNDAEESDAERQAKKTGINYITLNGDIGCLVNGAGLAMTTMDIIKAHGGQPANFLDVGGGANQQMVTEAFSLLMSNPNLKGILVNIFGGIMKCDVIATGLVAAAKETALKVPLVVRLEGTNVELGRKIIAESGLNIIPATSLDEAAQKIVTEAKKRQ